MKKTKKLTKEEIKAMILLPINKEKFIETMQKKREEDYKKSVLIKCWENI